MFLWICEVRSWDQELLIHYIRKRGQESKVGNLLIWSACNPPQSLLFSCLWLLLRLWPDSTWDLETSVQPSLVLWTAFLTKVCFSFDSFGFAGFDSEASTDGLGDSEQHLNPFVGHANMTGGDLQTVWAAQTRQSSHLLCDNSADIIPRYCPSMLMMKESEH